ncbi:hypothetical protein GCM10007207_09550 [Asaia siamensis]|uniref:Uncharacterized protein n=1 Tax=Asaia siamensis TaxID=110479 RepID=A0ABQ1LQU1_9PROT|nr:hypothetical protein GCM10007207_09550 [Asaia siamensis]
MKKIARRLRHNGDTRESGVRRDQSAPIAQLTGGFQDDTFLGELYATAPIDHPVDGCGRDA